MPANPKIRLETSHGNIVIELDAAKAPVTCENFITYVKDAFYDTTIFHRVIPGFMIQGGGFTSDMMQKPARPNIKNEADNGLGNKRGTIAMARTPDPHSASGQFFINIKDNTFLNHTAPTSQGWGYAVFGKVSEGMDIVDSIVAVPTGNRSSHADVPVQPVIVNKAVVVE